MLQKDNIWNISVYFFSLLLAVFSQEHTPLASDIDSFLPNLTLTETLMELGQNMCIYPSKTKAGTLHLLCAKYCIKRA